MRLFKKPKEVVSLQVIADKCTGCRACVDMCKRKVFTLDSEQKRAVVAQLDQCVGCGKCLSKMCRHDAIELIVKEKKRWA